MEEEAEVFEADEEIGEVKIGEAAPQAVPEVAARTKIRVVASLIDRGPPDTTQTHQRAAVIAITPTVPTRTIVPPPPPAPGCPKSSLGHEGPTSLERENKIL